MRRGMNTGQVLFPLKIEPDIPQVRLGMSSLPLKPKQVGLDKAI